MTTIVALGDSTTAGTPGFLSPLEAPPDGAGDEQSQFAYWLALGRPRWRVLNRGINRQTTSDIAARFERDVLASAPDVVIIIAGVNDVYDGLDVGDITGRLDGMYRRATDVGLPVIAGTILPYDTATAAQNAAMHAVNGWIAERAAADSLLWWCDTRAAVARPSDTDLLDSSPDGLHPSVDGYRRMASAIEPVAALALAGGGQVRARRV